MHHSLVWRLLISAALLLAGCTTQPETEETITVTLRADGEERVLNVEPGLTVNDLLRQEGIELNELDDLNPPGFAPLAAGQVVTVVRVTEELVTVEEIVPFERRRTVNEGLPAGEQQLLQPGVNGQVQIVYRITYRDGVEVSRSKIDEILIEPPEDEVIMVGSQSELPTITVNGTLVYVSGGNAWVVRQNSANRRPLTVNGGVDERVFELTADGRQLLFTRSNVEPEGPDEEAASGLETPIPTELPAEAAESESFNRLWLLPNTANLDSRPLQLDLENILYAEWVPDTVDTIVYSTAEPRDTFPGWQANNDLWVGQITPEGLVVNRRQILEPSSGGVYGFFGTAFAISPDGTQIAWAQPDALGVLAPVFEAEEDEEDPTPTPTPEVEVDPLPLLAPTRYERDTRVSFAPRNAYEFVWRPIPVWSQDGQIVIATTHGDPLGSEAPEDSPVFNLTAFTPAADYVIDVVEQVGIFAFAQFSPTTSEAGERLIAYLQADEPFESVTTYRLAIMDQDGSNQRIVFPQDPQEPGLTPQSFSWSPDGRQIAISYRGNVYLVDVFTGLSQQLTGDGLGSATRWAP